MKKFQYLSLLIVIIAALGCSSTPDVDVVGLEEQALQGDAISQNNIGSRYQFGDGVQKDFAKAISWYEKAASQGLPIAKANLGYMYDLGLGVPEDDEKAVALYLESAEAGAPRGMINLGSMYAAGTGVTKNYTEAYKWFEIARFLTQSSSDMDAKWASRGALDELGQFMDAKQIATAKKLASDWLSDKK